MGIFDSIDRPGDEHMSERELRQKARVDALAAMPITPACSDAPATCTRDLDPEGHNEAVHDAVQMNLHLVQRAEPDVEGFMNAFAQYLVDLGHDPSFVEDCLDDVRDIALAQARYYARKGR